MRWVDQGRKFLWLSERDGWRHVYLAAKDGTSTALVTKFDADVVQLLGADSGDEWVYFIASPDDPTSRYLYRTRTNGQGTPERVTPADQPGTHSYRLAPGGRMAFHTWSQFDVPPVIDVVELPSHRVLRPLTDTTALRKTLAPVITRPVEFFTVEVGDGISLDGWMLKPSSFDPAKRSTRSSPTSTASRPASPPPTSGRAARCSSIAPWPKPATSSSAWTTAARRRPRARRGARRSTAASATCRRRSRRRR